MAEMEEHLHSKHNSLSSNPIRKRKRLKVVEHLFSKYKAQHHQNKKVLKSTYNLR
jgi:hypothetical protein